MTAVSSRAALTHARARWTTRSTVKLLSSSLLGRASRYRASVLEVAFHPYPLELLITIDTRKGPSVCPTNGGSFHVTDGRSIDRLLPLKAVVTSVGCPH
jgi:hypothetical protein